MKYSTIALALVGAISSSQAMTIDAHSLSHNEVHNLQSLQAVEPPCTYLDETKDELDYQVDMFSRTLDERHWTNVLNLAGALAKKDGNKPQLEVHTWELMDKAFSFPRVRRYDFVEENMNMLEHFEDNLNTNISNSVNFANFLRVARTVKAQFLAKYNDGEFADPALTDPKKVAAAKAKAVAEADRVFY
jgi:hypothetical protein